MDAANDVTNKAATDSRRRKVGWRWRLNIVAYTHSKPFFFSLLCLLRRHPPSPPTRITINSRWPQSFTVTPPTHRSKFILRFEFRFGFYFEVGFDLGELGFVWVGNLEGRFRFGFYFWRCEGGSLPEGKGKWLHIRVVVVEYCGDDWLGWWCLTNVVVVY